MIDTITIDELKVGMYVVDLTCSNSDFSVKTQGKVKSQKIINQLKKQGVTKLVVEYFPEEFPDARQEEQKDDVAEVQENSNKDDNQEPLVNQHKNSKSVDDEFARSCNIYDSAGGDVKNILSSGASTQRLSISAIKELANNITESVLRNEYAMAILTRIRHPSTYQWEHVLNSGVLMCGFSLYLGFEKETLKQITLGAMLHDIGVAKVPRGIVDKPGKFTKNDMDVMKKHVAWGQKICKEDEMNDKVILDMVLNHHERLDGSGYPRGLDESKLSKLARMIAIVDVYDAMTADRTYKKGDQPINVLRYLMANNKKFDRALVQQFIKYLGVHPVGSLVKLSDEKLAIVVHGNRNEPVKPKIKIFYNIKHQRYITSKECDLAKVDTKILASVRPEDYDVNLPKVIRQIIG
jgi:HD-GYP domain-containing protein (c-di-GMP phosphodiesterase class II)